MSAVEPAASSTGSAAVLRFLRVALHVSFAALLVLALVRVMSSTPAPARYLWLALSLLLAAVYLTGTVVEKRHSAHPDGPDPGRFAVSWLALVTALWLALLLGSAEFSWLAFPLFFLHLHVLPRPVAFATIAAMAVAVVLAQWAAGGQAAPPVAVVVGPLVGAAFSVVTGLGYRALYEEGESQRRAADELRRTRVELARTQHDAGVLAERGRLAREIHDTLAQGFSSIVLVSRAAAKSLDSGDTQAARQRLAMVQQTAADNLAEARGFVRGLAAPDLADESLAESLARLCERTEVEAAARGVSLRCRFALEGSPEELPPPYGITVLRAAQASLANVWAHANARNAVVTLGFLGTEVTLDVFDDGVGFDPEALPGALAGRSDGSGFGLRSLRARVEALAGTLALESAPGEGTVVAIRLPLGAAGTMNDRD
ncbi:MAG: sensor histidine kinase [Actinomycetales bacterium]